MNKTFYLTFSITIIVMITGTVLSTLSSVVGMPKYILLIGLVTIPFTLSALSAWLEHMITKRNLKND